MVFELFDVLKEALIPVILLGIGVSIGLLVKHSLKSIKNRQLQELAYIGVRWASEKLGKNTGQGVKKHSMVSNYISKRLKIDQEDIDVAIHAAVKSLRDSLGNEEGSLKELAYIGVRWASEKLGKNTGQGAKKHSMVSNYISKRLKIDQEDIDVAIHAAVKSLRDYLGNEKGSPTT